MGPVRNQKCKFFTILISLSCCVVGRSAFGQTVAQDSANFAAYAPQQRLENWALINGGYGYGLWTPLTDTDGGFVYMEGVSANNRQVDGQYSFGIHVGDASYGVSRSLSNSLPAATFSILTRFDVEGHSQNMVSLRSANNTSFSSGELLAFGILEGNQLFYRDANGTYVMNSGDARGDVWSWSVNFDAVVGTYSLAVTNMAGGFGQTSAGNLEASNTTVGSFAALNSSADDPDLIFDLPTFTAPLQSAVTWTNPASITYGTALGPAQLNATANLPGSFTYSPPAGTVLNAGTNFLSVIFTPSNTVTSITDSVSIVVLLEPLTVAADSTSRDYGQSNPVFTGTITGLTNGDNITAIFACDATPSSAPGTYPIVPLLDDPDNRLGNYAVTTNAGTLTVTCLGIATSITNEPENEILPAGAAASFSVSASGPELLSYQWFFGGTNLLDGATNAVLVITNIQEINAGVYSVLVSNACGSVLSSNATLTIGPPGDYWINPAGGEWSDAANWLNDSVPSAGDNVYIVLSGAYTVDQDVNAALGSLTIAPANDESVNVIVHTNVELFVTNATETGFVDIGAGGSLTLAGGYLELDDLVLTNGGSFTNIAGTIVYAKAYQLENGGTVSVNGGSINTATNFTLGGMANSSGALVVNNGGSLTVSNATLGVGNDGTTTNGSGNGSVTVSNATLQAEFINLGSTVGGLGSLTIQSNATVTVSSNLTVVSGSKAIPSVVSISGGSLVVTNPGSIVQVGSVGSGDMTIAGGQHIINQIHLGSSDGTGTGSLYLLGGNLHILSNMSANFIVVDGIDIDGSGGSVIVGEGGAYNVAEFDVYAGTATNWSTMNVGYVAPGGLAGAGLYVQSGGNVTFTNTVTVGDDSSVNAVGQLTLKGGSLYITNASHTGTLNVRNGSVDLNGGTLVVDILILTNTSGVFQNNGGTFSFGQLIQSGGSIVMTNEVINTGKTTVLGGKVTTPATVQYVTNSTHSATLNIVNGTFVVSNGATLIVDTLVITNANGHFKKLGGTLIAGQVILAPYLDADGDGQSNTNELLAGTDPLDPTSLFQMVNSQPDPNGQDMDLSWTTEPFHSYVVQEATNAPDGTISAFVDLSPEIFASGFGPSVATYTDYGALVLYPGRYYRVRLGP